MKVTKDWSFHIIEPTVVGFNPHTLKSFDLIAINKFQKIPIKQELNLLIWTFETEIDENKANHFEEISPSLEKSNATRFEFHIKNAFIGKECSIKGDLIIVQTPLKIKDLPMFVIF